MGSFVADPFWWKIENFAKLGTDFGAKFANIHSRYTVKHYESRGMHSGHHRTAASTIPRFRTIAVVLGE